jgi:hypothetical protein
MKDGQRMSHRETNNRIATVHLAVTHENFRMLHVDCEIKSEGITRRDAFVDHAARRRVYYRIRPDALFVSGLPARS